MLWLRESYGGQMWDPFILPIDEIVHRLNVVWSSGVERLGLTQSTHKIVGLYITVNIILLLIAVHYGSMVQGLHQTCVALLSILPDALNIIAH